MRKRGCVTGNAVSSDMCKQGFMPQAGCCLVQGGACKADKSTVAVYWCHCFSAVCCIVAMASGDNMEVCSLLLC